MFSSFSAHVIRMKNLRIESGDEANFAKKTNTVN